ncbi:SOS response-associated peptidase [Massilia sp. PWRC2]|uniref:SOS response-associated peptidase n=1 Tax=Massilia sp. PWRC2 TaxID=2804626 RepID=UPI003CF4D1A2
MCANYTPSRLDAISEHRSLEHALFGLTALQVAAFDYPAEAFPGYRAPILREVHEGPTPAGCIEALPAMFGMVPHWADQKLARQTYNARSETVASKPSFRNAWKRNQFCVIPADNFYEPCYETGTPVRWRIAGADGQPLAIAGIWEAKAGGADGLPLLSFSMLTINADGHPLMQRFHKPGDEKRMLVLLDGGQVRPWLEGALVNDRAVYQPWPAHRLVAAAAPAAARLAARTKATTSTTASLF